MTTEKDTFKRKAIGKGFIERAFEIYPEWKEPLNITEPTYPKTLEKVDFSKKQMSQLPFDEITKSVLCGTIISDTSFTIDKGYANARFQVRQSTRQFTWFTWKYFVILKEFCNLNGLIFSKPDGYQAKSQLKPGEEILGKLKLASKAHEKLTELHKIVCFPPGENRKTVQRFWLNHMNNYFLMTIWLDDGSLYNKRQGIISFNAMPISEQLIFREYLLNVWRIETSFQDTGLVMQNGQPNLRISINNQESLLTLLRLIAPIVPVREMLYKVCFVPKGNSSLLERWKTELKGLVKPEFVADIEKYYANIENSEDEESA
jgi:hypothetical protein